MLGAVLGSVAAGILFGMIQLNTYLVFAIVILVFIGGLHSPGARPLLPDLEVEPISWSGFSSPS
ncbi:hypothetical protein AYX19_21060 (plasmid) [Paenarthrobacter ureafaciens]|nr:hypothetical protein AYX19_21060 [Paenarthrobacter ureafaciens]